MSVPSLTTAAIPHPAFIHDTDGRIAEANGRAEALAGRPLAGCSSAAVVGIFDIRSTAGSSLTVADLPESRALAGEEAIEVRLTVRGADGRTVHVLASASPLRGAGGTVEGALVVWQDVSSLVAERAGAEAAEEELKEQVAVLRLQGGEQCRTIADLDRQCRILNRILRRIPHYVGLWSIDGRCLWTSDATAVSLGPPPEDRANRTWQEIGMEPGAMAPLKEDVRIVGTTGAPLVKQISYPIGDGYGWCEYAIVPFPNADGAPGDVLVGLRDITERKLIEGALRENQALLASVLSLSTDGIYRRAFGGERFDYVNPAFETISGFSLEEIAEFDREAFIEVIHPDDRATIAAVVTDPTERRGEVEYRFRRRGGDYRWLAERFAVTRSDDGRSRFITGVVRDVTGQREDEEALRRYSADLERSNQELRRFAYVASHDLQEPLRSIVSFSQLLERRFKGRLDADADEYLGFIVEGGQRMQALIEDLLLFSRIETQAVAPVPTETGEVIADAIRSLDARIREAQATITIGPMPVAMTDRAQLEQVFTNLIGNALKYHRLDVPAEIRISAEKQGDGWEIAIADNGIGIEAEYYDRIFEMFRRLHTKDQYDGTGIGLAVVKKIVERLGGFVRVESTPGEGSTFFFTLPAA